MLSLQTESLLGLEAVSYKCLRKKPTILVWLLGVTAIVSWAASGSVAKQIVPKQDRAWKSYRNVQLGYCLSYPARWGRGEAFDGAGFYIESGEKRYSRPMGEIDVAVFADPEEPHAARVSLSDSAKQHLDGLITFERAERMKIKERRSTQFLGSPAFLTKDSYYDPQDRYEWSDEVLFVEHNHALFRLELECRNDHLDRFQSVFDRLLNSFRFDCSALQ